MFDAWEMKSPSVEEAREASGLLIVAAWMIVCVAPFAGNACSGLTGARMTPTSTIVAAIVCRRDRADRGGSGCIAIA